jgi:hypothetical protein
MLEIRRLNNIVNFVNIITFIIEFPNSIKLSIKSESCNISIHFLISTYINIPTERQANKFTPVEDQLLLQLINIYGKKDWNEIANHLIDRTPKQCRNRFQTYLSPVQALHPWSIEEDEKLTMFVQTRGPHFDDFYEHFPERTVSNLKNRWYIHLIRKPN